MSSQKGFTVIELLIATAVFGMVLLVISIGVLQISRVYYKGITERNTQNVARSITDQIAQSIQFGGGVVTTTPAAPTPGSSYAFCVGNRQYSYQVGHQLVDSVVSSDQKRHALTTRNVAGCPGAAAENMGNPTTDGRELLAPKMRLANLQVENIGTDLYKISVKVVYGDSDILNNPTATTATCQGIRAGAQFCAVSDLTTVVTKRVE
jgi:prepilin-type N-terminal cleavage/methylation domain-containing protein